MPDRRPALLLLVAPALAMVLVLFVYPLGYSLVSAFTDREGHASLANFAKTFDLYRTDVAFTLVIVVASTALTGILAAAIGGYLVLGAHPAAVALLRWLYRWPLFVPFIVAAQCMRTFLAKNGILNNSLDTLGLIDVANMSGLLDWRGIVVAFVVLVAALLFRFTAIEFVGLVLCFAVVIAAELFNTTLEVLIDYAWPEHHPMIGRAKDVAAAAVLVAAGGAALVGALLFARHLFHLS